MTPFGLDQVACGKIVSIQNIVEMNGFSDRRRIDVCGIEAGTS